MLNQINDIIGKRKTNKLPINMYNHTTKLNTMKNIVEEFNTYLHVHWQKECQQNSQFNLYFWFFFTRKSSTRIPILQSNIMKL